MTNLIRKCCIVLLVLFAVGCDPLDDFEAGPLGAVEIGEDEPMRIRSLFPITGAASSRGASLGQAVELAVRDFGGIHGRVVDPGEPVDAMCSPEGGQVGAGQIVADLQVAGIIGTACSASGVTASPVISEAGFTMISPANASPLLTSDLEGNAGIHYYPGYFRVVTNDLYRGQAVADFAYKELGLRRMGAVHDGDPYTTALVSAFGNAFRTLGGEAVTAGIAKGDTDMTAVLAEFAVAGAEGLFVPLFLAEGSLFVGQAREFDGLEGTTLITGSAMLVPEFLGSPQSEGMYFAGPVLDHSPDPNGITGKNADAVLAAFEDAYGGTPASPYWAHAYDAATLLLAAIESVGVEKGGKLYVDRLALRQEVEATTGFQGIIGVLSCDDFGDCGTGFTNIYHHPDLGVTDAAQLPVVYRFTP